MHTGQGVAETGSAFSGAWKGSETVAKGKYQDWLTEEGLLLIEGWARDGLTYEQIAKNMGINRETLNRWKKLYPNISNALKKGRQVVIRELENALIKRAMGYEYEEIVHEQNEDGLSVRRTTKQMAPDTTALIFALKNMDPEHWRDKRETQLSGSVQTVPDRLVIDYGDNAEN
jgi:transposase-like protein